MRRRLLNTFAAVALILGGYGGALAEAVCRHEGPTARATAHACCRAKTKAQAKEAAQTASHSTARTASHSSPHAASEAPRPPGHCHAQIPDAGEGRGQDAAAQPETRADTGPRDATARAAASAVGLSRQVAPCGHCVSGAPSAPARVRDREGPRRAPDATAASVAPVATSAVCLRAAAPTRARAAPRGSTRLYVLINRFLI